MNFGREFPNAQQNGIVQNGDSWFVVTPENPVPVRSNPVLVEMQGNQMGRGNWQDLLGMYSDLLQESTNDGAVQTSNPPLVGANGGNLDRNGRVEAEINQHLNQNFESNLLNFRNCSTASRSNNHIAELLGCQNAEIVASANGTLNKRIHVPNRATNSNAYTQAASSWKEPPESNGLMLAKQSCISGSNQRLTNSNSYTRVTTNWTAPESNSLMLAKQNFTLGSHQRLTNLNSYSQMASNWTEPECTTSLMPEKQNFTLGSSQRHIDPSFTQVPDAGFTVPYWPNYNLSSPPRPEPDAALHRSSSFHFAPVTPDQAKQLEHQRVSLDESSSQEKDKQWNVVTISMSPEIEKRSNDFSQIVLDSASATPLKEKNVISHEEAEEGIDLNKTPEQKMPRRRKHRPKVVIEGKPKRVRKAVTPKTNVSGENPSGKRKYVRKKGLEIPESQQGNTVNEVTLTEVESSQKYCRRALNFDLETGVRNASHDITDSHQAGRHRDGSGKWKYEREKSFKIRESQQDNVANEDTTPIVESSKNSCRRSLNFDLETRASYKSHDRTDSQRAGKSQENKWPFNLNLNSMDTELCTEKNQQNVSTCNLTCPTNQRSSEYILLNDQRTPPTTPPAKAKDHLNLIARNVQMRKSVAGHSSGISGCNQVHQADSSLSANFHSARQLMLQSANQLVMKDMANFNEKRGLKRAHCHIVDQIHPRTQNLMGSSILSQKCSTVGPIASETCKKMSTGSGQVGTGGLHSIYANNATSQINALNGTSGNWCIAPKATKQNFERQQASFNGRAHRGLMAQKVYQSTQAHDLNSLTAVTSWKLVSTPLEAPTTSQYQQWIKTGNPNVSRKKKKVKPVSLNQGSRRTEIVLHQQQSHAFEDHRQYPMRARGQLRKQKLSALIEEITYWLEGLNINCTNNEVVAQEQHALVPYKGSSTIVPFEGFDHIKKRKPRPKVDLDPETDRIWKLLMGIEGSESAETTDKDKEKWWEEERKMFRGRADSFIARMHLVQGDRRFSRWKGSVVDSVIGVFLTQNVSDHLSSSAFMCLAARFPLQSTITTTCYQDGSVLVEEPDIPVLESDSSMNHQEEAGIKNSASEYDRILAEFDLSQNSFGPPKYRRTGYSPEKDFYTRVNGSSLLDVGSTRWHHQSEDPRLGRVNNNLRGSSAFPYPLNSQILHMREPILSSRTDSGVNNMGGRMREIAESQIPAQLNGVLSDQAPPVVDPFPFLGKHRTEQGYLEPERSKTYNPERTAATEPRGPIRGETKGISGTSVSNSRKGKAEGENKSTIDWDSLRKEAQSNGKRERSKEAMDSLDYEAVRLANVNEISNAIKERGMNNMLADRIKNFLNRLVTDHGSIDLEWLRDVPPDKAKDYLLSIRGLGLKSVECVRLLTLHQLAFPVDTNVGRIAVRLGWVPLQPLPESLQLHLLELYPILESIQKYIWPRLCKLDQQTLYELHYQMITFGKVFCTKSKPNCNACPMRGECRHFASAFASARLALPGPEEKSLVSSAVPVAPDNCNNPVASIRPMPLLQAEKDQKKEAWSINKKCEPIVEEPSTPEQEITAELLESDIEDVFYEDPDEIPTIKLNIEEFTLNLQNYMQDNMELQEGDMSRALVALNPEVASIPTPKLKNVSRLRTEHQVYELPDNHPLLEGMDKREPDDPSPYLLAIWTPGETANSVQPPESRCETHESGQLCNDQTCFSCNSTREANSQIVRGTLLIPCRTAMRGSFPLNGTYFQVNEMFADHASSLNPISVPRSLIWNLNRRTVYFGTSVSSIFKGLPTEGIQFCFWKGFVCVRGFDQKRRCPRPLMARLHFPASKLVKTKKSEENLKA